MRFCEIRGPQAAVKAPSHRSKRGLDLGFCRRGRRRLRDRLSEQDLSAIVESFRSGTPAHVLAKRYGVGETSVKALLRQRGVRRTRQQPYQGEQQSH
ncbi:MAG: hypothetical protein LC775_00720 [Acidobacteria bacterium]|nr:hypothetical protein [Acidobacteriota bacterium]